MFFGRIKKRAQVGEAISLDDPAEVKKIRGHNGGDDYERFECLTIIYDGGHGGCSLASGQSPDGSRILALRWNGDPFNRGQGGASKTGIPASGGYAEWFPVPEFLWSDMIAACERMARAKV